MKNENDLLNLLISYFYKNKENYIKNINSFTSSLHCIDEAKENSIIIPFTIINNKAYIIIEKRSLYVKQAGELSFPGGSKEDHEKSFLTTALRETYEEIGLSKKCFDKIKFCGIFTGLKTVIYVFVALIKEKYSKKLEINNFDYEKVFKINKNEVERIIFFPLESLAKEPQKFKITYKGELKENIPNQYLKEIIDKNYIVDGYYIPYERVIKYWEYEDEVLWGYSADIIYYVINKIKET